MTRSRFQLLTLLFALGLGADCFADQTTESSPRVKRLLLIGQSPDGHPFSTHEYMSAARVIANLVKSRTHIQTIVVNADEPWTDGPELLESADAAVVFVSEGGKWLSADPKRLAAFRRLAKRGGGLICLHWGMGCKDAKYIAAFRDLFGGCHGGPDRKYKVVETSLNVVAPQHAVARGLQNINLKEEFYYRLKLTDAEGFQPLLSAKIEGEPHTVSWVWDRADGGRSFGFSGLHFHENWERPEYRRLIGQATLWVLKEPVPNNGLQVDVPESVLRVPPRKEPKGR